MIDASVPTLGLGLGIFASRASSELARDARGMLDFVEIHDPGLAVEGVRERLGAEISLLLHGSGLSPASARPPPEELVAQTRRAAEALGAPWVVEDIAVWRSAGPTPPLDPYWPLVFDDGAVDRVASRLAPLSLALGRPFVSEFPPLDVVLGTISPVEFFVRLAARTPALFALDVSHWLKYAQLVGADPVALFDEFPLDRVVELHISGGLLIPDGGWYDEEHAGDLVDVCIDLLGAVLPRTPRVSAVTVECHAASTEVMLKSLERCARVPDIAKLRSRTRPSVASLEERERLVAELLADPVRLSGIRSGRIEASEETRKLATSISDEALVAHGLRLVRHELVKDPVLLMIAEKDSALLTAAIAAYVRGPGLNEDSGVASFVAFVAENDLFPAWASDLITSASAGVT
jgi:uncharacterized protein (UPF0276 family)